MEWRESDGIRWLEAELPRARAAFTARTGGVSETPYESLNLGILTGDRAEAVRENRRLASTALRLDPRRILIGRQVHAAEVSIHRSPQRGAPFAAPAPGLPEVDGHATAVPALAPLVFVADCLPVALAGPGGVAMIHCGWRGLAAGIVERGVRAVAAEAAAIGPGIGPCCYEVGEEVIAEFERLELGAGIVAGRALDLSEIAARLLARAGVTETEHAAPCTSCNPDLFFSHRRDGGRTGRQAGLAWIEEATDG